MITKTSLENFDMIFLKSGKKLVDLFSRLFCTEARQLCVVLGGGRLGCRLVLNSVGRSELSLNTLLGSLAQVSGLKYKM